MTEPADNSTPEPPANEADETEEVETAEEGDEDNDAYGNPKGTLYDADGNPYAPDDLKAKWTTTETPAERTIRETTENVTQATRREATPPPAGAEAAGAKTGLAKLEVPVFTEQEIAWMRQREAEHAKNIIEEVPSTILDVQQFQNDKMRQRQQLTNYAFEDWRDANPELVSGRRLHMAKHIDWAQQRFVPEGAVTVAYFSTLADEAVESGLPIRDIILREAAKIPSGTAGTARTATPAAKPAAPKPPTMRQLRPAQRAATPSVGGAPAARRDNGQFSGRSPAEQALIDRGVDPEEARSSVRMANQLARARE